MQSKAKSKKLVLLDEVRGRLVFPHTGTPMTERSLARYLEQLGIQTVLKKVNGEGQDRSHVTLEQADQMEALFRAKHWRKFKAATKKGEKP